MRRVLQLRILGEPIPSVISGHEDEAQIVDVAIMLARCERGGVAHGLLLPVFVSDAGCQVPLVEDPHHSGQKSIAPIGPHLAFVLPFAVGGVHRIEPRMTLHQLAGLLLREPHRVFKKRAVRFQEKLDHALWILAARAIFNMYLSATISMHGSHQSYSEQQRIAPHRRRFHDAGRPGQRVRTRRTHRDFVMPLWAFRKQTVLRWKP